ncbi:hypothetical protein [Methylomarinum vadi]|uniref:hypothetical protein n=1 Tax=Methylomarinum vadi TaxID=438855 RepID=UPI0004DFB76A|nr:hypothetical protein [Methylomarinum vadi]
MISAIESLNPEIRNDVLKQLNQRIYSGALVSRYTYSEYKDYILFLQSVGITPDDYYESMIDRFTPAEYQLMLSISKDVGNPELKQKVRMLNQKCKRIIQRLAGDIQEQNKNKRWWKRK